MPAATVNQCGVGLLTRGSLVRSKGLDMPMVGGKKFPYTAKGKKMAKAAAKKSGKKMKGKK